MNKYFIMEIFWGE